MFKGTCDKQGSLDTSNLKTKTQKQRNALISLLESLKINYSMSCKISKETQTAAIKRVSALLFNLSLL